ncbi:MAG: 50S ribosomal protein L4 [Deltaproteobacteria bacterium]|nr:50S ribosomal protein L4 [Deltaproteobacteria bacterium]
MTAISVYSKAKEKVSEIDLVPRIFDTEVKEHLIHDVVRMQLARRRSGSASTKTRSMVRGGGAKPWRQKGTGRARAGTIRSPLWRGGGVVFGPSPRKYDLALPKKVRRGALRSALSLRNKEGRLWVLKDLEFGEIKTRNFVEFMQAFGFDSALVVLDRADANVEKSARNVPGVKVLRVEGLNVYDILSHENLVFVEEAVQRVQEVL